ncbi:mitochondrial S-adenosylmethionine transporter [Xylariomycetidae sp. FL2044]|nr:mitochondrial S-adenosylmethionine transporter [Xylariomycetidae sp. FL2044]
MSGNSHVDVMLAGAAAAFTVDLMIYPLDTLKTRQQSRDFVQTFANPSRQTKLPSRQLFRGLYQGIGIVIVATLPAAGIFFSTYEAAKSFLGRHGSPAGVPQPLIHSAASAVAECASCLVLTPAEVIKQNAQMLRQQQRQPSSSGGAHYRHQKKSTSLEALRQLGGPGAGRKLLSGYAVLVARNLPFTAIQFPLFERLRARIWERRRRRRGDDTARDAGGTGSSERERQKPSLWETGVITGISAGLAGSFAALITTPMDVVKTRMMISSDQRRRDIGEDAHGGSSSSSSSSNRHNSRGTLAVAREVLAERGVPGLFRGAILRSVWTAVGSGLYLGTYKVAEKWLTQGKGDEKAQEDDWP